MISEAEKLARLQLKRETTQGIITLLKHPVFSVVLAYIAIEYLQKVYIGEKKEPLMGKNVGTVLEAGLIVSPFMVAMAESGTLREVISATGKSFETVGKLAPVLAAA